MNEQKIEARKIQEALTDTKNPQRLFEYLHPLMAYDLAEIFKQLDRTDSLTLIQKLPITVAAEALELLEPERQYQLIHHLDDSSAAPLLKQMSSDTVVDMLLAIHPRQSKQLLDLLPEDYRRKINQLMTYPEDTAGSLMTVDYISARTYWHGEQALKHIRKVGHEAEIVSYIYVIGAHGQLEGIVSLREIILASPDTLLSNITTTDIISVPAEMEQEEVAHLFSRYDLYALPVINQQNKLIGIITVDDVLDVIQEEATEDVQKLSGSQPLTEPYFKTSVWSLFSKRIIWILILFVGGAYTANVLEKFESVMEQVIVLSFFIPLLIGTGGNTGSQIVGTLVRALAVDEVKFQDLIRVIKKEMMAGLLLGCAVAIIAYVRTVIMNVAMDIGLIVGISALLIVLWASFISAMLPLILHRLRVDPAVVSGPLITTVVDGTGLIIYFSIAKMVLQI